jgi:hypothetical protein
MIGQMGDIAGRMRRKLEWDPVKEVQKRPGRQSKVIARHA